MLPVTKHKQCFFKRVELKTVFHNCVQPLMDLRISVLPQAKYSYRFHLRQHSGSNMDSTDDRSSISVFISTVMPNFPACKRSILFFVCGNAVKRNPVLSCLCASLIFITAQPFVQCADSNAMLFTPLFF